MDKLLAMKPGSTFDAIGPTSFTSSEQIAMDFSLRRSRGQGGGKGLASGVQSAVVEVLPGARGVPVGALSPWRQQEVLSAGRFRIKEVVKKDQWTPVRIIVEQVATFRNTKK